MIVEMLPWVLAAVSLFVLLAVLLASARSQRHLRVAHEESIATKNEQIAGLETQLAALRESESIRFVDRYLAAKKGLEERIGNLGKLLETTRAEQDKLHDELNDLGLTESERQSEKERLIRDLSRTTDQIRRLEMVLREVSTMGVTDVQPIQSELDGRRELASHIKSRLDRLGSQDQDRQSARRSRMQKMERLNNEAAGYRRDIEVTRAATSIIDGILGIDSDTRKRLARHATAQIQGALDALGSAAGRDPIARFVEALEKQRPDRLLERGEAAAAGEPADAPVEEDDSGPMPPIESMIARPAPPAFSVLP